MESLIALLGLSVLVLVYPFIIYPLLLSSLPRQSINPVGTPSHPAAALLICARNEAEQLPIQLARLRKLQEIWPKLRILVWNDGSTDATAEILASHADHIEVRGTPRPIGKSAGLRRLHNALDDQVELLFFADANT
ncbi:MAG: glycosyltransferase, partial [Pseudomonadota bacterium]